MPGERLQKALANGHGDRWELAFPTNYIKAADLRDRDVNLTIKDIEPGHELQGRNGKKEHKVVVYFEESEKMLVLNKTNAKTIAKLHGKELTAWIGARITLFPTTVEVGSETADAVRVRPKVPALKPNQSNPVDEQGAA